MGILAHGVFALKKKAKVLAVVFAFAIIGGALVWGVFPGFLKLEKVQSVKQPSDSNQQLALAKDTNKDSDGDGLKDWEEALYGTNPQKADTDGDGTPDGEEIRLGRDPLKKGPNDKLQQPTVAAGQGTTDQTQDTGNLTYNLTKSILESGVLGAIDQNGNLTSTDFIQNIKLPDGIDPNAILTSAATARSSNVSVKNANTPDDVRKYFNEVAAAYEKNLVPRQGRGDILVIADVLDTKDYSKLKELDPIIEGLRRTIADIELIVVPSDYVSDAVRELNYLLETKRAVEIFRNTENDPLATLIIFKRRIELLGEMTQFHREIVAGLITKGITVAPK